MKYGLRAKDSYLDWRWLRHTALKEGFMCAKRDAVRFESREEAEAALFLLVAKTPQFIGCFEVKAWVK